MTIPKNVVNPFSDAFLEKWELWKAFRWEEHKFKYKGVISEQMALKRLCEVAEGEEERAVRIIEQSISRGWMDFYTLKQPSNNGSTRRKKPNADNGATGTLRERVQAAAIKRYGGGKPPAGSDGSERV